MAKHLGQLRLCDMRILRARATDAESEGAADPDDDFELEKSDTSSSKSSSDGLSVGYASDDGLKELGLHHARNPESDAEGRLKSICKKLSKLNSVPTTREMAAKWSPSDLEIARQTLWVLLRTC